MLLSVSYISSPVGTVDNATLSALWIDCIQRNEDTGITGGLLFSGDFFFQTLEGELDAVDDLMTRIERDPRHTEFKIVAENDLTARMFAQQPMKLIDASESEHLRERFNRDRIAGSSLADTNKAIYRLARL